MSNYILDTLAALVTAAESSVALADVSIINGPRVSSESDFDRLFIGVDFDPANGLSMIGSVSLSNSVYVTSENVSILCVAEAWSGSDLDALRAKAFGFKDAVRELVRPSPAGIFLTVKALQSVNMGDWSLYQVQTSRGPYVGIAFSIECVYQPTV